MSHFQYIPHDVSVALTREIFKMEDPRQIKELFESRDHPLSLFRRFVKLLPRMTKRANAAGLIGVGVISYQEERLKTFCRRIDDRLFDRRNR